MRKLTILLELRLSVELVCAQDDKLLEVLTEELANWSVFTSALQVNHLLDLKPKLTNDTVSKEDPWLLDTELTDRRTDLTEGRTFDTETETKPTWMTEEEWLLLD